MTWLLEKLIKNGNFVYCRIIYCKIVVRRPVSKLQRHYNGGNVGTRCATEND